VLKRIARHLTTIRSEKRNLATAARALALHMEPGVWWLPFARLLVHARAPRMPRHARSTIMPRPTGWRAMAVAMVRVLMPPLWVWVPRQGRRKVPRSAHLGTFAPARTAAVVLLAPTGRSAVCFDRAGETVTRVAIGTPMPRRIIAIRRVLQSYLPMPAFDVTEDRQVLREDLIDGSPFFELSATDRTAVFEALLTHYTTLVRHERRSPRPATVAMAFGAAASLAQRNPSWAHLVALRDEALTAAAAWPCVPSHGDLSAMNLVVANGRVRLIDFEFAEVLPFFYDLVKLTLDEASCGRDDLLVGIRPGGRFDRPWRELWASAGLPSAPDSLVPVFTVVVVIYARRLERVRPVGAERLVLEGSYVVPELGVVPIT
jgi:hypothetical protein